MAIPISTDFDVSTSLPIDSRIVATDLTVRDAIPLTWRFDGLMCYVIANQTNYQLIGGTANANWTELKTGTADTASYVSASTALARDLYFYNAYGLDGYVTYSGQLSTLTARDVVVSHQFSTNVLGGGATIDTQGNYTANNGTVNVSAITASNLKVNNTSSLNVVYVNDLLDAFLITTNEPLQPDAVATKNYVDTHTSSIATTSKTASRVDTGLFTPAIIADNAVGGFDIVDGAGNIALQTSDNFVYVSQSLSLQYLQGTSPVVQVNGYLTGSQRLSITGLTASVITASTIYALDPTENNQVATKYYVDNLPIFGFHYYFRTGSTDVSGYNPMLKIDVPLSASTKTITVNNVSSSQYIASFIAPPLSASRLPIGNCPVHFHGYRSGGAGIDASLVVSLWLRDTASAERLISDSTPVSISTDANYNYTTDCFFTSSFNVSPTDRLVCKFQIGTATGNPNVSLVVDDDSGAGVYVPLGPASFVLKAGDVMTGTLTGPGYVGTASFASSSITSSTLVNRANIKNPTIIYDADNVGSTVAFSRYPTNGLLLGYNSGSDPTVIMARTIGSGSYFYTPVSFDTASGYWIGNLQTTNISAVANGKIIIGSASVSTAQPIIIAAANELAADGVGGAVILKAGNGPPGGGVGGNITLDAGLGAGGQPNGVILLSTVNTASVVGIGVASPVNRLDVQGNISCSAITASLFYGTASNAVSASWAPGGTLPSNLSLNSLTASFISASNIQTVDPINPHDVATKNYVDNINATNFDLYFRSSSAGISNYHNMFRLDTPISASTSDFVVNAVSASQYVFSFISPVLGISSISPGTIDIHCHTYRVGGNAANSIQFELYIRSGSTEYLELPPSDIMLLTTTTTDSHTMQVVLTSSLALNPLTDRIVAKMKCVNATGTPNIHTVVEGNTAAGVGISVPSSNFPLKSEIGKSIVLCSAYTPLVSGADLAEYSVPYYAADGTTIVSWNLRRFTFRAQTAASDTSSINIEKSTGTGGFSATTIGSVTLTSGSYENYSTGSGTVNSGDKLRFNVTSLGTAQNWTITTELGGS